MYGLSDEDLDIQARARAFADALGWVAATPPSWLPPVATRHQIERYLRPTIRGERGECYAISEEGAGSDVDAIEATARRDGAEWVLNGVKWHVTSFNSADYCFFQAKSSRSERAVATAQAQHLLFLVDRQVPASASSAPRVLAHDQRPDQRARPDRGDARRQRARSAGSPLPAETYI